MNVIYCYGDISIKAIVIHSPLLFILSRLDRPFIYLCHLFHSTPHVFFIMLLFSTLVSLFLLYNYQYAKARFTMTYRGGSIQFFTAVFFTETTGRQPKSMEGGVFCKAF